MIYKIIKSRHFGKIYKQNNVVGSNNAVPVFNNT